MGYYMDLEKNYYKILGVQSNSNKSTIKKAYKKAALKYHPDVNKSYDAEKKFKEINEAYNVLSNEEKRKKYDSLKLTQVKRYVVKPKSKKKNNIIKGVKFISQLEKDYGLISELIGTKNSENGSLLSMFINKGTQDNGRHRCRHKQYYY